MIPNGNENPRSITSESDTSDPTAKTHSKEAPVRANTENRLRTKEVLAAKSYLENTKMVIIGDSYTVPALVTALLHISQSTGTKSAMIEGIKAIATLIREAHRKNEEDEVTNHFAEQFSLPRQELTDTLREVRNITTEMKVMSQEIRKERSKTLMGVVTALDALEKSTTYATVVATNSHVAHKNITDLAKTTILAKRSIKNRQILIDDTDEASPSSTTQLGNLNTQELLLKANLALEALTEGTGKAVKAVTANKLQNRGIVYELNDAEMAKMIREDKETRIRFIKNFSSHAEVKARLFPIIVERVPIKFNPDDQNHLRDLEEANSITGHEIVRARWIKPPARRTASQRAGHIILMVSNPQTANRLIREGTRAAETVLWTRKLLKEPSRCLKCHRIGTGHLASTCPEEEKCGTCGRSHSTKNCTVTERDDWYCINCRTNGHASWDRCCPTFMERNERMARQVPDNQFRYFPIDGTEASWEKLDGSFPQNNDNPPCGTQTSTLGEVGKHIAELLTMSPRREENPASPDQTDIEPESTPLFFPQSSPPVPSPVLTRMRLRSNSTPTPPMRNNPGQANTTNQRNPTLLLTQPPNQMTLTNLDTWVTFKKRRANGNTNPPHSRND